MDCLKVIREATMRTVPNRNFGRRDGRERVDCTPGAGRVLFSDILDFETRYRKQRQSKDSSTSNKFRLLDYFIRVEVKRTTPKSSFGGDREFIFQHVSRTRLSNRDIMHASSPGIPFMYSRSDESCEYFLPVTGYVRLGARSADHSVGPCQTGCDSASIVGACIVLPPDVSIAGR